MSSRCVAGARGGARIRSLWLGATRLETSVLSVVGVMVAVNFGGKPHIRLSGHTRESNRKWTSLSAEYSRRFAARAALNVYEVYRAHILGKF